jgi:hypothetical protein
MATIEGFDLNANPLTPTWGAGDQHTLCCNFTPPPNPFKASSRRSAVGRTYAGQAEPSSVEFSEAALKFTYVDQYSVYIDLPEGYEWKKPPMCFLLFVEGEAPVIFWDPASMAMVRNTATKATTKVNPHTEGSSGPWNGMLEQWTKSYTDLDVFWRESVFKQYTAGQKKVCSAVTAATTPPVLTPPPSVVSCPHSGSGY